MPNYVAYISRNLGTYRKTMQKRNEHQGKLAKLLDSIEYPRQPDFLPLVADNIHYDVVTNSNEMLKAFSLRFSAYTENNLIMSEDFPLEKEFDRNDNVSVHFFAKDLETDKLVGCTRLILDTRSHLQIDETLDISDYRSAYKICEMSRLICYPGGQPNMSRRIRFIAFKWAQMLGIQKIVGISPERQKAYFDKILFIPMQPYRGEIYSGSHFRPLVSTPLYGNVFPLDKNEKYVSSLL